MKTIIINGNPNNSSFCYAIHERYRDAAIKAGHEVRDIYVGEIDFNVNLTNQKPSDLEAELLEAWAKIEWAEHIIWVYPVWWGIPPAIMKGFIDRLFLPGLAYEYQEGKPFPKPLLKGKTSEIIYTMDTPVWYYKLAYKNIGVRLLKNNVGAFCGIRHKRTTYFSAMKSSTPGIREKWLKKVEILARLTNV